MGAKGAIGAKIAVVKRVVALLTVLALVLAPTITVYGSGADYMLTDAVQTMTDPDVDPNPDQDFEAIAVNASYSAVLPAKSAILIDQQTGRVLYEMNADEQIPPASVTKIMTLLLVMEALESGKIHIDDMVTTSEYANSMGGSQIWLKVGEEMSVNDMLKAVAIASANDASAALGEHVAGGNDAFVQMMNDRAKELGMLNTHFMNATGLDEAGHLTTARDISIMSRELMKYEKIAEYSTVWMDSLRGGETELVNTNKLVRFYKGATGLKTGTTDGAGSCLSATASRDGLSLCAVVMGCPTSNDRFASARGLLDFGFANYQSITPPPVNDQLVPVKVLRGVEDSVMPVCDEPGSFVIEKGQKDMLMQEITLVADIEAPVEKGQVVGKVEVLVNGELMGQYDLRAAESVDRMTFLRAFGKLVNSMLKMNNSGGKGSAGEPQTAVELSEAEITEPDDATQESANAMEPCSCGMDKCYCDEIGDICGCTEKT